MKSDEYWRGFEDAVELAHSKVLETMSYQAARQSLEKLIGLLKERKFLELQRLLEGGT